jgi:protein ImuA
MPASDGVSRPDPALIADLRARIERIGGWGLQPDHSLEARSFGVDEIDAALPWGGLPRACVHEVAAADISAAAAGFCAVLLARLAGGDGAVAWCGRKDGLYGPGLAAFGLDATRLIVVRARTDKDVFWAMEEGLRSGSLAAVLGEAGRADSIALRRLQLAAETGGVTALLLRPAGASIVPGSVTSRWRVGTVSGVPAGVDRPRWRVEMRRCRAGTPATWLLEWRHETGGLAVAADLRHRPAAPAADAVGSRWAV